jgi:hypothetical protein
MKNILFAILCSSLIGTAFADQAQTATEAPKVIMVKQSAATTKPTPSTHNAVSQKKATKITKKSTKVKAKKSSHATTAKHKTKAKKKPLHSKNH